MGEESREAQEQLGRGLAFPEATREGQELGGPKVPQGTTPGANRPQQAMAKGKGHF